MTSKGAVGRPRSATEEVDVDKERAAGDDVRLAGVSARKATPAASAGADGGADDANRGDSGDTGQGPSGGCDGGGLHLATQDRDRPLLAGEDARRLIHRRLLGVFLGEDLAVEIEVLSHPVQTSEGVCRHDQGVT